MACLSPCSRTLWNYPFNTMKVKVNKPRIVFACVYPSSLTCSHAVCIIPYRENIYALGLDGCALNPLRASQRCRVYKLYQKISAFATYLFSVCRFRQTRGLLRTSAQSLRDQICFQPCSSLNPKSITHTRSVIIKQVIYVCVDKAYRATIGGRLGISTQRLQVSDHLWFKGRGCARRLRSPQWFTEGAVSRHRPPEPTF